MIGWDGVFRCSAGFCAKVSGVEASDGFVFGTSQCRCQVLIQKETVQGMLVKGVIHSCDKLYLLSSRCEHMKTKREQIVSFSGQGVRPLGLHLTGTTNLVSRKVSGLQPLSGVTEDAKVPV